MPGAPAVFMQDTPELHGDLLRASAGAPLLLPRLLPLGDLDPEELLFETPFLGAGEAAAALPPAISAVQRQLLLASCILEHKRADVAESGGSAMSEDQPKASTSPPWRSWCRRTMPSTGRSPCSSYGS